MASDRPSLTFSELSLDAIALPIEMGCRRRGDRSSVSIIQLLDGAGWGYEVGDRAKH